MPCRSSGGLPAVELSSSARLDRVDLVRLDVEVLDRPLVRGLRDAERRRADQRPGQLEGRERVGSARRLAAARPVELALELLHPAEQVLERNPAVLEDDLGGVRGADADLRLLLALAHAGRPLLDDERGLAAVAELGGDVGDDDVDVGDPAVGDEDLGAVEDPLVAVALGGGTQALDVGAGAGLGDGVSAELDLVADAEAFGDPAGDLIGRARCGESGGGEAGAGDRERDAAQPQWSSSAPMTPYMPSGSWPIR